MAFEPQHPVTRNPALERLEIRLYRTVNEDDPWYPQTARFEILVVDQFGHPMNTLHGDLVPHLSPQQIQQILAFMDQMWQKAENEVIP